MKSFIATYIAQKTPNNDKAIRKVGFSNPHKVSNFFPPHTDTKMTPPISKAKVEYRLLATMYAVMIKDLNKALQEKDKKLVSVLETKINKILSNDNNLNICTLLEILNKKMNNGQ